MHGSNGGRLSKSDIYAASSEIARRGIVYTAIADARAVLTDPDASEGEAVDRALRILTAPSVQRASEALGELPPPLEERTLHLVRPMMDE